MIGTPSAFLQQAAHLTGGVYLCPARPAGLLQYLLMVWQMLVLLAVHHLRTASTCGAQGASA